MASSDVQTVQKAKNLSEQYRNAPELTQPPGPYSTHGKTGCTTHQWAIGQYLLPHNNNMPQHRVFPDQLAAPLTTSTAILDLLWALLTRHLQGWPASTCLRPNDLETFRHVQGHPDSPSYVQAPQVHPDHLQITHRSPAAVQEHLECLEKPKLENSGDSDANQVTQYIGLGLPSWLTPTPQYVVHVCYFTTCKAPPETTL